MVAWNSPSHLFKRSSYWISLETLQKHNEKNDRDKISYAVTSYVVVRGLSSNHFANYETRQN